MTLTKEDIIKISGIDNLDQISKLDLSNKNLDGVYPEVLNQLTGLEELSLANNRLRSVKGLSLPNLCRLDLTNNLIMDFHVGCLDHLEELMLFGNPLTVADHYIAVDQLPNLKKIDRKSCQPIRQTIQRIEDRIRQQMESIWSSQFSSRLGSNFTDEEAASLMTNFARQLKQALFMPEAAPKYKLFKVHSYAKQMMDQKYEERRGGPLVKVEDGGPIIHKIIRPTTDATPTKSHPSSSAKPTPKKRKASPSQPQNGSVPKSRKMMAADNESSSSTTTLEPTHLLRCHSFSNCPDDDDTQVWAAAFSPQDSEVVATCGGHSVCFINCSSGKVIQKYQHSDTNESLYSLCWSDLPSVGPILATGGQAKSIHLVWPQRGVCYKSFLAHQGTLNCLLFDPLNPTLLYSGSDDKKITLWDLGCPSHSSYKVNIKKKLTFTAKMTVIRLALSPTEHPHRMLLAAGEGRLLGWNVTKLSKDAAVITFDLPWVRSSPLVDGLLFLSQDLICCKESRSGRLLVWNLNTAMENHVPEGKTVACSVTCQLNWKADCDEDYIYPAGHPGSKTVYCGDDQGQVWVYQLDDDGLTVQSHSVLDWPGEDNFKKSGGILVNNMAVSEDGQHLVVCTNRNLVAIWRRFL